MQGERLVLVFRVYEFQFLTIQRNSCFTGHSAPTFLTEALVYISKPVVHHFNEGLKQSAQTCTHQMVRAQTDNSQ